VHVAHTENGHDDGGGRIGEELGAADLGHGPRLGGAS
jgi:hypothetical protein